MKPWVIKLIFGLAGFGVGFGAGFFCHKKMNDIQFEEVSEEEMQEIENRVSDKRGNDDQVTYKTGDAVKITDEVGAAQKLPDDPDEIKKTLQGKTPYMKADADQKTAYERLWKATAEYSSVENANNIPTMPTEESEAEAESPEEEDFDDNFLEQIEREAVEAGNNFVDPPHEIDIADFYNERPEYDKVTIKWFEPDNVWLDENEEIIADISSYIGTNRNLFATPGLSDDPDVRFIRNDRYGSDYEVIRHHRSYRETVGE